MSLQEHRGRLEAEQAEAERRWRRKRKKKKSCTPQKPKSVGLGPA